MGLGSLVLSQERQHFKEFLPEIVPERAASPFLFTPTAGTFRLEKVTAEGLRGELATEIASPCLRKNPDRCAISLSLRLLPGADPCPPEDPESILPNVLRWLHEDAMKPTAPHRSPALGQ
ncbi:hypothetical protein ANANG_G00110680 [Anguilla anguilla]|uniref:Uncharacterized protein n=1 Tax=Anguilla anguilla TaxID=7936 RepID=A0A9D3MIK5_ANGAN|nr:hypothetical protein ANANG_G00110680 [Anguilla anguilla]